MRSRPISGPRDDVTVGSSWWRQQSLVHVDSHPQFTVSLNTGNIAVAFYISLSLPLCFSSFSFYPLHTRPPTTQIVIVYITSNHEWEHVSLLLCLPPFLSLSLFLVLFFCFNAAQCHRKPADSTRRKPFWREIRTWRSCDRRSARDPQHVGFNGDRDALRFGMTIPR